MKITGGVQVFRVCVKDYNEHHVRFCHFAFIQALKVLFSPLSAAQRKVFPSILKLLWQIKLRKIHFVLIAGFDLILLLLIFPIV